MKPIIHCLLSIAILVSFSGTAHAQGKPPKKKKTTPLPVASATPAASSGELSSFMSAHLDAILGPIGPKVEMPRADLAKIRHGFSKSFSKASLADRPKFQLGLNVCDAISEAM